MFVLSLFDGMACGRIALKEAGIAVERYIAYEIDKYAIQTAMHNFSDIEEKGDVFKADFTQYADNVDLLIGGSPCVFWSVAQSKHRETVASGVGWNLFSQYVRAVKEAKPKFFLYENNKSMSNAVRQSITDTFGFAPVCINSALVSAQNRQRLYWCGVRQEDGTYKAAVIEQPEDRHVTLKDVLDDFPTIKTKEGIIEPVCVASRGRNPMNPSSRVSGDYLEQRLEAHTDSKTNTLTTVTKDNLIAVPILGTNIKSKYICEGIVKEGNITVKGSTYPIKLKDGHYIIRNLTLAECKRLQTVPDWFEFPVAKTHALKQLGSGWTVEVIKHLLLCMMKP